MVILDNGSRLDDDNYSTPSMFNFPNNPEDGDVVSHPNGKAYEWNSSRGVWSIVRSELTSLSARVAALETFDFLLLE